MSEHIYLTATEKKIVRLLCEGLNRKDIAAELGLTPGTVKTYMRIIYRQFGIPPSHKDKAIVLVNMLLLPLNSPLRIQ
jgi:DNA-binding NarL/FixJ family response regulator